MPTHFVTTKNINFTCGFCAPIAIILQKGVINAHKIALHVCNDTGSSCKVTDHVIQVHNVGTALVHSYPALTKVTQSQKAASKCSCKKTNLQKCNYKQQLKKKSY